MSLVTNVLDWKIFVVSITVLLIVSIINTQCTVLPVSSISFTLTVIIEWFISVCITFFCLHKLLQRNEPVEIVLGPRRVRKDKRQIKPNAEKVKALTKDIDRYFVSKWYTYVSKDESFVDESQRFIEDVINRLIEVQLSIDNKVLLHGILNIYLKHLKEFRRGLRRQQKYSGSIEELYRYSHLCSTNSKSNDYFLHQLTTNLLHHFINSELWNSLPCQVLVSILAKKLVAYILKISSNPDVLNNVVLKLVASKEIIEKYDLNSYARIKLRKDDDVEKELSKEGIDTVDDESKHVEKKDEQKLEVKEYTDVVLKNVKHDSGMRRTRRLETKKVVDLGEEPKEELTASSRTASDPVKIYEARKSKSTKTWSDSKDLALGISLGQDPLDVLTGSPQRTPIKNIIKESSKTEESTTYAANQFLNEVKHTTQTTVEDFKKSIKPISDATVNTLHNIKDLQETTMNSALHKIGDFQDEAAGMVEGILDFGRAGLRKGLRLTGLQDNIDNAKISLHQVARQPSQQQHYTTPAKKKVGKVTSVDSAERTVSEESVDSVWMNPLQMDFDGQILLEKSTKPEEKDRREMQIPSISTEEADTRSDSPEPEYEDTADLASSIAKLRSLLQQRSSESTVSTPALSPIFLEARYYGTKKFRIGAKLHSLGYNRPQDEHKPPEAENVSDLDETDGVMPSFYKFCAKTATGVLDKTLHTIKTALPSNTPGLELTDNAWIFVQAESDEADIYMRMKKLLTERKEFCTLDNEIDTAYEAIDSLDTFQLPYSPSVTFEDELDPFEVKLPITRALVDIVCELLADTDSPFVQEPIVKALLLTLGPTVENYVVMKADKMMERLCVDLISIPEKTNQTTFVMEKEDYIEALLSSLPDTLKVIVGKPSLSKALSVFVSSMQTQKINQDIVLQVLELAALKLIEECNQLSSPASV